MYTPISSRGKRTALLPSLIRTVPSAPAFHRIVFATGELAGLVGFTTLPPVGSCPTLRETRPAPKVLLFS